MIAEIIAAVHNPGSIAPRNGHKETYSEWTARVVCYVLTDEATVANARRALLDAGYHDTDHATLDELAALVLRSVGGGA